MPSLLLCGMESLSKIGPYENYHNFLLLSLRYSSEYNLTFPEYFPENKSLLMPGGEGLLMRLVGTLSGLSQEVSLTGSQTIGT